jgi:streptogramin lyase
MSAVRTAAAEFPAGLDWVNVDAPPRLADLRGRVVLLWFWSYDAVNCWNLMPALRQLEDKYHDGLSVFGVHCPKYPAQCEPGALLRAVNRHGLRHPVAGDPAFRMWQDYRIEAWPSVALIDAEGGLAAVFAGEGRQAEIDACIAQLLDEAAARDLRVFAPAPQVARPEPPQALAFPAGLLVDAQTLYVADSGHHCVLECDLDGRVRRRFGSGNAAFVDGEAGVACFHDPRGLARRGDALYVADRGNHAVRRIDLRRGRVDTVLGTGRAGRSRPQAADPRATALNTPLALAVAGDDLFVAVAGQHQLWRLDLAAGTVSVFAGGGEPGLADGALAVARLAQPSGLAVLGRHLLVADAASSALRLLDLDHRQMRTVVGRGLYEFGDVSGVRDGVRLQNPLAVAVDPHGVAWVADSYNHAIKRVDCRSGATQALHLVYPLHEPAAVALAGERLWIANTNRHEIVRVELGDGAVTRVPVGED